MIIDAHTHINIPVAGEEKAALNAYGMPNFDIEAYIASFDANNVDKCFVFSHDFNIESKFSQYNDLLSKLGEDYKGRLYPFGCICPFWTGAQIRTEIRRCFGWLGLYGLKFVPVRQGNTLASEEMDIVAEECERFDVPVFFHDGSPEYCSAVQIAYYAKKHPGLKVISGHGGLRELWSDYLKTADKLQNLYICLSGPPQLGIQKLYEVLGPEKLLFGSDGGIGHRAITTAYLRRIQRMDAPAEHKEMILGKNAARLLNIL